MRMDGWIVCRAHLAVVAGAALQREYRPIGLCYRPMASRHEQYTVCCKCAFWAVVKNGSEQNMNGVKMVAIVIIVAGVLSLGYGGFSYTKDTTAVKLGPIELSVKETKTVNVPLWAGLGAIVLGGLLLVFGSKK